MKFIKFFQENSTPVCIEFQEIKNIHDCWFLVLGILHGVQDKFRDDVSRAPVGPTPMPPLHKLASHSAAHLRSNLWPMKMGTTAAPETSSGNLCCTPCKIPKIKNLYLFHGDSLKPTHIWLFNLRGQTIVLCYWSHWPAEDDASANPMIMVLPAWNVNIYKL